MSGVPVRRRAGECGGVRVELPEGALLGYRDGAIAGFRGIPFAQAARFRPPEPAPDWQGVRSAVATGPCAPQRVSRLTRAIGPQSPWIQDEACLNLNVWTPDVAGCAPVLVFLHGGGFLGGSGGASWYDGRYLAARGDIVVVTVNYRLGALGYLYLDEFAEAGGAGNYGLLDQIRALEWVRERIGAFGGDPRDVTVAGQSAGASSLLAMLSAPAGRGLFRRAIVQSAPGAMMPPTRAQADATGRRLLTELGVDAAGLAEVPVAEILAAQHRVRGSGTGGPLDATPPFHPVATPGLVAADPIAAVGESAGAGTTLMVGTTADEAAAFFTGDPRAETLPADRLDAIAAQWFGEDDPGVRDPAAMTTEYMFTRPAARLAELLRADGKPCDTYRFAWHPPGNPLRACHCMELPFVFGTRAAWRRAPMLTGADTEITGRITESVQHRWLSFIRDEPIEADPVWDRADERMRPPTPKGI